MKYILLIGADKLLLAQISYLVDINDKKTINSLNVSAESVRVGIKRTMTILSQLVVII